MSTRRTTKTSHAKPMTTKAPALPKGRKAKTPAKPVVEIDLSAEQVAAPILPTTPIQMPAKPMSGLDAAALVLKDAGEPLDVQAIMVRVLERGLWKTEGKTPAATLYSAIIREIRAKGSSSRFQKVDRGRFAAAG